MSFIDLATLTLHRRTEMETRINVFISKCDQAMGDIDKLKLKAQGLVDQLNCKPSELKERFLNCMKTLDEYIYLITDFNLSILKVEETTGSVDYTPVHDTPMRQPLVPTPASNILDILSEPTPSTSTACPNNCPIKHKVRKVPKNQQKLIVFSSESSSLESVPEHRVVEKEQEVQCELAANLQESVSLSSERHNLPAQTVLQTDQVYPANIMNIDGPSFWIVTDSVEDVCKMIQDMTAYYSKHRFTLTLEEVSSLTYCAVYDDDTGYYYRALFIRLSEEQPDVAEVFLVDTGEIRAVSARSAQPLHKQFTTQPPFARCCHLAGVELNFDKKVTSRQEQFLSRYCSASCSIQVDDNTSESLGVYLILPQNENLNDLLVKEGLAISTEKAAAVEPAVSAGPPELRGSSGTDLDLDLARNPEYEDALEAVTGYSCRDEADICKHYKGGPEKTCFKGAKCTKRHILKHPDGWTLDRVEVMGKIRSAPLPEPGAWTRARVSYVCHFDRFYVHFENEKGAIEEEPLPDFGVVLPPTTLDGLVRAMNSPAQVMAYKPLKITPAEGELVAALYPPDNQWYRARVVTVIRPDQSVEVQYIDYGNRVWVKEESVRAMEPCHCALPAQAALCALAGVAARGDLPAAWAAAKKELERMTLDRMLDAHIIARDYEEVTIELYDADGYSIAEQLAVRNLVKLNPYSVVPDSHVTRKLVVP